jgi:Do/DeqQ family serine protease
VKQLDHPLLNDPAFREFFGNQVPDQLEPGQNENSLGSGVIVRPDGYILTNNHVVSQADQIIVALQDGRRAVAKIIGTDPDTDLAVIKIDLDKLPVLPFKLSGNEVGDVVLAIGNPFGVGQTVTQGIISATGRSDLGINTYEDFIQTDAAINPGNSGGALIDVAGNLIGVNTAIFSQSGGSLGIGFAIPAKVCQQVLNSILKDGRVVRGWLGISLMPVQQDDVMAPKQAGVVVADVLKNGPAAQAGLLKGDKIIQVNDEKITSASHLINYVALQAPNSTIKIQVDRAGQPLTLDVVVGERQIQNTGSQYIPLPKR